MKREFFKRAISLVLGLVLTASLIPVRSARAAETDLEAIVEQQIRAFADSIDKKDADDSAASALAKHGITGGGKTLKVGKSHALTATLMNSELALATMTRGCYEGIRQMQQNRAESVFDDGGCYWGSQTKYYSNALYPYGSDESSGWLYVYSPTDFSGKANAYDASLVWMVGSLEIHQILTKKAITKDSITYNVTVSFEDRFDFSTATGSFFKDLLGIFGTLLFREFDWVATATYTVTVPYACDHAFSDYHWRYIPETGEMASMAEGGFEENWAERYRYTAQNGMTNFSYELERTVTLQHDAPWVLEYTVKNPGYFVLSPTKTLQNGYPHLMTYNRTHLFYQTYELVGTTHRYHSWGYTLANLMNYTADQTYRVRLENVISANGNNMIYLSVYNCDLQKTVLQSLPMDDYYWNDDGVLKLQNSESDALSGMDLMISYIGNASYPFSADYFELKIWENGVDGGGESLCTTKVTKPTCTAKGYTTYTCAACGYSYKADSVKAKGHSYKVKETAPTCTEGGYTTYTCSSCKDSYTETIPALGHAYSAGLCATCGTDTVTAELEGNEVTLSGEFAEGTRVFAACYDGEGRFTGGESFLWQGEPLAATLPDAAEVKLFFAGETHAPLREEIRVKESAP